MSALTLLGNATVLLGAPVYLPGIVQRTKARWSGRRGPRLDQTFFDLRRLLQKEPVYSETSAGLVRHAPLLVLATALVAGTIVPFVGTSPFSGSGDFVAFAYLLGLGRLALMLSAMDTGSAFEGMGVVREATFGALVEPAFFLLVGAGAIAGGSPELASVIGALRTSPMAPVGLVGGAIALLVLLQIEASRVPVDDPATHLELTMIHEVMVLDHSGTELAMLQYAAGIKLTIWAGLLTALLNPYSDAAHPVAHGLVGAMGMAVTAVVVGSIESLVARLRLRVIPAYALAAVAAAAIALVALGTAT